MIIINRQVLKRQKFFQVLRQIPAFLEIVKNLSEGKSPPSCAWAKTAVLKKITAANKIPFFMFISFNN